MNTGIFERRTVLLAAAVIVALAGMTVAWLGSREPKPAAYGPAAAGVESSGRVKAARNEEVANRQAVVPDRVDTGSPEDLQPVPAPRCEIIVRASTRDGRPVELLPVVIKKGRDQHPVRELAHVGLTDEVGTLRYEADAGWYEVIGPGRLRESVTLGVGERREVSWVLEGSFELTGEVVDWQKRPVPGAEIQCVLGSGMERVGCTCGVSGQDGRFAIVAWEEGVGVYATSLEYTPSLVKPAIRGHYVQLQVQDTALKVVGSVLSPEGQGIAGALVVVGDAPGVVFDQLGSVSGKVPPSSVAVTGDDGEFEIVAGGSGGRVTIRAQGWLPWSCLIGDGPLGMQHHFEAENALKSVKIRLEPGAEVAGVARYIDGQPAEGVSIIFGQRGNPDYARVWSDREGKFSLKGLPEGPVTLRTFLAEASRRLTGSATVVTKAGATQSVDIYLNGQK